MTAGLDKLLAESAAPEQATLRFQQLFEDQDLRRQIEKLPAAGLAELVAIISISNFLFRLLCRHPEVVQTFRQPIDDAVSCSEIKDFTALKHYKYRELLRLTRADLLTSLDDYPALLDGLTRLAETVLQQALQLCRDQTIAMPLCMFGLGKLGAAELNYSSDVDLVFVTANPDEYEGDYHEYGKQVIRCIRLFSRALEEPDVDGFLYRVDLKLRPWGRSGPLAMSVDETEQYYEGSSESWERFAWLRARVIAGTDSISDDLGNDLLARLQPFVFSRTFGSTDLERFVKIKSDMAKQRQRAGSWDVKVGVGGIRDIEFFVQMLQLVNGGNHPQLKTTNTLTAMRALVKAGLLSADEADTTRKSYLFLRQLENRLQMIDERQTHHLPDNEAERRVLARSLGYANASSDALDAFETELERHQMLARSCFERILPEQVTDEKNKTEIISE